MVDLFFEDKDFIFTKEIEISFNIENKQCEKCKKSFTPTSANSTLQIRQKPNVPHKRAILNLKEILIKRMGDFSTNKNNKNYENNKKRKDIKISEVKLNNNGIDFTFFHYKGADKACAVIRENAVVINQTTTTKLLTHDVTNNTQTKHKVILLDICPINRGDLLYINKEGKKGLFVCSKVGSKIWVGNIDNNELFTLNLTDLKSKSDTKVKILKTKPDLSKFVVTSIRKLEDQEKIELENTASRGSYLRISVSKENGNGEEYKTNWGYWTNTKDIKNGEVIEAYDIKGCQFNDSEVEDYIEQRKNMIYIIPSNKFKVRSNKKKEIVEENELENFTL